MNKFRHIVFLLPLFLILGFVYFNQPAVMNFKSSKFQTKDTHGKYGTATLARTSFLFNFANKSITEKSQGKLLKYQIDSIKEAFVIFYKTKVPETRPKANFIYCHISTGTDMVDSLVKYGISYQYIGKKITQVEIYDFIKKIDTLYLR